MKWFKHDSNSLYDPKLRNLGDELGAEGIGIYWGIITYLACHGEEFQVKIVNIGKRSGKIAEKIGRISDKARQNSGRDPQDFCGIPLASLRDMAMILFTTPKIILGTIETSIEFGLLDSSKWNEFGILYSPELAKSQEAYSKKLKQSRDRVRTLSGQTPEEVSLQQQEQDTEQETEQEEDTEQDVEAEKDLVVLLKSALNVEKLSTSDSQDALVLPVSDDEIKRFRRQVCDDIRAWNQREREKISWNPTDIEICRLLRRGDPKHRLRLCYQSMNLLGGDSTYPQVVRWAVGMMLAASRRKSITNPFGWLWTCLHGNGGGTAPWVQLATAEEEA